MAKYNINYGIDLGTTNSSIARMNGDKIDVIQIGASFIMPSCVHYRKNGDCFEGERANNEKKSSLEVSLNTLYSDPWHFQTQKHPDPSLQYNNKYSES